MSIKSWLMPAITQRFLSRGRLLKARARAEMRRAARGERHQVHYFHQADDPYSALVASILPKFVGRYDVDLTAHVVGPPPDNAAPEREKLIDYSRKDANLLARHWRLKFDDHGRQPSAPLVRRVTEQLVTAAENGSFVAQAGALSVSLWDAPADDTLAASLMTPQATAHLTAANALRKRLGHYLGATFYYGGEWYWGIDRLHHLERRLQELGTARSGVNDLMFPPDADLDRAVSLVNPEHIDFFVSLRSPYSAIATFRVFKLAKLTGAQVRLRYVLPMVMRGLPVPREKRIYISQDAAREAFSLGIPFGRINDPVGRPTERGLALIPYAERVGKGEEYLQSFMGGVWAEGMDAGSDRGLRKIVERCGLSWEVAGLALKDESWRKVAEQNRQEMFALGLWGVPSFKVGSTVVWGQDRLWAVQQALLKGDA
ncbi:MAG: DsbA family protein [Comamonadaceae bacterium]